MRSTSTRLITSLALAGLLLAGCNDPETTESSPEAAGTEREDDASEQDPVDETEPAGADHEAAGGEDETPTEDETPPAPFDPDDAIPFTELEVRDELIFPDGPMPDSLVVPAGTTVATYSADMGDNEQYHNATGALRVDDPDAEPEQVMAFFPQHLSPAGWELAEERDNGMQVWHREHPDERVWTQQLRVETVKSGDHATIRWWFTNNG